MTTTTGTASTSTDTERADLLAALTQHRHFLRFTTQGLTDEQASRRTTVSELTLAGLVKHLTTAERTWTAFIRTGPSAFRSFTDWTEEDMAAREREFRMTEGETLSGLLEEYDRVAAGTDELVRALPDLGASQPLPEAPWFEQGARWSARRVLLHLLAETAQHAGHADIIREALDGQKTMG